MKVVIACGGTGGHIFPGIAVAQELQGRGHSAVFVVTQRGGDAEIVEKYGFAFRQVKAGGIFGKNFWQKVQGMLLIVGGFCQSLGMLGYMKPDVILGMGAYSSIAPVMAGYFLKIPCIVHEQNVVPGRANLFLEKYAKKVLVSFPKSIEYFHFREKVVWTGNPVREEVKRGEREEGISFFGLREGQVTILAFGGSLGASKINDVAGRAFKMLAGLPGWQGIHITGKADFERIASFYETEKLPVVAKPFVYEMGFAYAAADIVISRAGASTIAEISLRGRPSILVPYPHAVGGHQRENARVLEEANAAIVIEDGELTPGVLEENLRRLILNEKLRQNMGESAKKLAKPDAPERVVDVIEEVVGVV